MLQKLRNWLSKPKPLAQGFEVIFQYRERLPSGPYSTTPGKIVHRNGKVDTWTDVAPLALQLMQRGEGDVVAVFDDGSRAKVARVKIENGEVGFEWSGAWRP